MRRGREAENPQIARIRRTLLGDDLYDACERRNNEVPRERLEARLGVLRQQGMVKDTATVDDRIEACELHTVGPNVLTNNEITRHFTNFDEVIEYAASTNEARAFLARYIFGEHMVITMDQWIKYENLLTSAPKNVLFEIDDQADFNTFQGLRMLANNKTITTLKIHGENFNRPLPAMPLLQTLKIDSQDFDGTFPDELPALTRLEIESANFNQPLPVMPLLQTLTIKSSPFNSTLPAELPALTKLTIDTEDFDQPLPLELPSLLYLNISSRTFNQVLPADMLALRNLTILSDAFVPDDNLRGMLPFNANIAIEPFE